MKFFPRGGPMARRKKFVGFIAAATAIAGVALYLPSSPFFNGAAFGAGYGTVCPVGLSVHVNPVEPRKHPNA